MCACECWFEDQIEERIDAKIFELEKELEKFNAVRATFREKKGQPKPPLEG